MVEIGDDGRTLPVEVSPLSLCSQEGVVTGAFDEEQQHNDEAEAIASTFTLPLLRRAREQASLVDIGEEGKALPVEVRALHLCAGACVSRKACCQ